MEMDIMATVSVSLMLIGVLFHRMSAGGWSHRESMCQCCDLVYGRETHFVSTYDDQRSVQPSQKSHKEFSFFLFSKSHGKKAQSLWQPVWTRTKHFYQEVSLRTRRESFKIYNKQFFQQASHTHTATQFKSVGQKIYFYLFSLTCGIFYLVTKANIPQIKHAKGLMWCS